MKLCKKKDCKKNIYLGNVCKNHKNDYLLINNDIILERLTNHKDYLKKDIIKKLKDNHMKIKKADRKEVLFDKLIELKNIIRIQKYSRKKIIKNIVKYRGKGYINLNLCNNTGDFYTLDQIPNIYFISYQDINNIIWSFDIRSLNKLKEVLSPRQIPNNPFTTQVMTIELFKNLKKINKYLKNKSIEINHIEINESTREETVINKMTDLSCDMSSHGYHLDINWFLDLSLSKLKKLYLLLEDIWNWRAELTNQSKRRFCPPNGLIFNIPPRDIELLNTKLELQEILLNDFYKFKNTPHENEKGLLYMYILLGLSHISKNCYESNPWLNNLIL